MQNLRYLLLVLLCACNADQTGGPSGGDGGSAEMSVSLTDDGGGGGNQDLTLFVGDGGVVVRTPDGGARVCYPATCQGKLYQCGDCLDNDGDGRIDSDDPECLGACDNSESGLDPQIPGGNNAPCKQDCFFDQDTGSGNDDCYWDHGCDTHEVAPSYYPEGVQCKYDPGTKVGPSGTCASASAGQSAACTRFCKPLTPNGCDCFGCCAIGPQATGTTGVFLGSRDAAGNPTCTLDRVGDPTRCHPCDMVPGCYNPCGRCQLCIGKDTLPPDCFPGGGSDGGTGGRDGGATGGDGGVGVPGQCPAAYQPCGLPGQPQCAAGTYCVTGCCIPILG